MSGQRGGETKFPPFSREDDFPYGIQSSYGQPKDLFPGNNGKNPSYNAITPRDTQHSVWDEIEEVIGSPILLTKGSQSTNGVPGTNGSWASGMGDWNADQVDQEELDNFGENLLSMVDLDREVSSNSEPPSEIVTFIDLEPFSQGLGHAYRIFKGGLIPRESVWREFKDYLSSLES